MNGFECKRMLDAAGGPRVPTIFITALPSADVDASLAAFAPVAVLYKPFDKDDLLDAVERACG
jgi:FixJ family two-component response regulator